MWDGKWLDRPKGNVPHSTVSDKAAASELKKAGQVSPSSRPASPSARARPLTIRELIVLAGCVAELVTGWLEWGRRAGGGRQKITRTRRPFAHASLHHAPAQLPAGWLYLQSLQPASGGAIALSSPHHYSSSTLVSPLFPTTLSSSPLSYVAPPYASRHTLTGWQ